MGGQQLLQASFRWPWDVVRQPDGAVVMARGALWRNSRGLFLAALAVALTVVLGWFVAVFARRPGHNARDLIVLSAVLCIAVWSLVLRTWFLWEQWQARPGTMTVRKRIFGLPWGGSIRDGQFIVRRGDLPKASLQWRLILQAPGGGALLAWLPLGNRGWEPTEIGTLVKALAQATGFPVEDAQGSAHDFGLQSGIPETGEMIEIRHRHTGQILRQGAGNTLSGVDLAGLQLEGADL